MKYITSTLNANYSDILYCVFLHKQMYIWFFM